MQAPWRIRLAATAAATLLLAAGVSAILATRVGAPAQAWREPEAVVIEALRLERPKPATMDAPEDFERAPIGLGAATAPPAPTSPASPAARAEPQPPAALVLACLNPDPRKRPPNCPPQAKLAPDRSWRDQAVWDKGLSIPPKLAPKEQARDPAYASRDVAEVKALAEPACTGVCIGFGYVPPVTFDPQTTCEKGGIGPCVRPPERNAAEAMEAAEGG